MSASKKKIAVFFGGRSPEHDVSVVTGLQVLRAIDQTRYDAKPVYIAPDGQWYYGDDLLRDRNNYMLSPQVTASMKTWHLDASTVGKGMLRADKRRLFEKGEGEEFDVAIPAFHGLYGEDGNIQGLFEFSGIPYVGMRTMASAVLMDKVATKRMLASSGIPMLPFAVIKRPDEGFIVAKDLIEAAMGDLKFPCIVKPAHLGSSIGIAKVNDVEELRACLPAIFEMDDTAILEPFVENLVEYNVAVSKAFGDVRTSAIERPKATDELLDFKQKYLSGGSDKGGDKLGSKSGGAQASEGMLSLTRDINPDIAAEMKNNIQNCAKQMFETVGGCGAPRIDFIGNSKTGELWLNEVNPMPGSFGYFLWEAAEKPVLFTEFLSSLIEEAIVENKKRKLPSDPVPKDARLLKRKG
ncbi:MAG: D-alanine--D-alanine ligase [Micavibrio sp.]|nr:D-alanine--D-alanine ligase [Micavibrio sp.]